MTIKVLRNIFVAGVAYSEGAVLDLPPALEADWISHGWAVSTVSLPTSALATQDYVSQKSGIQSQKSKYLNNITGFTMPYEQALIAAPARANTTAYLVGDMTRTAAGQLIQCVVPGTSGASDPVVDGTATGLANQIKYVLDGSVYWRYLGVSRVTNASNAPTVTLGATTTLTETDLSVVGNQSQVSWVNAQPVVYTAAQTGFSVDSVWFNEFKPFNTAQVQQGFSTTSLSWRGTIEFYTDAPSFSINYMYAPSIGGAQGCKVYVDGQSLEENVLLTKASPGAPYRQYKTVTYNDRRLRLVRVEFEPRAIFKGIGIDAQSVILPCNRNRRYALFVTDSMGVGSGSYPLMMADTFTEVLYKTLGFDAAIRLCYVGNGYMSSPSAAVNNSLQIIQDNKFSSYNITDVVLALGVNDAGNAANYTPAQVAAQATIAWNLLRAQYPFASISSIFIFQPNKTFTGGTSAQFNAALVSAFSAWGDSNSQYIDPISGADGAWIQGTGRMNTAGGTGNTTGTGNADWVIQDDQTHFTVPGARMAAQMAALNMIKNR